LSAPSGVIILEAEYKQSENGMAKKSGNNRSGAERDGGGAGVEAHKWKA
jgi:hypothetical protein